MGFLTTITIYNDGVHELTKYPKELAKKLENACLGIQRNKGRNWDSLGYHGNLLILQKPRHADDETIYFHSGNTVKCIDDIIKRTRDYSKIESTPNLREVDDAINQLNFNLKRLKDLKKEIKNK